jgi:Ca2+-binding RTX toxin-like protein
MKTISLGRLAFTVLLAALPAGSAWLILNNPGAEAQTAPRCKSVRATIVGTGGSNEIEGTPGRDVIAGRGGHDDIDGESDRDLDCGGRGNDELNGDTGRDRLYGGKGFDEAVGDEGNDVCRAEVKESC